MVRDDGAGGLGSGTRLRVLNAVPLKPEGAYVVYWMTAFRRTAFNHALDRAVALAVGFGKPLIVFEALRADYA